LADPNEGKARNTFSKKKKKKKLEWKEGKLKRDKLGFTWIGKEAVKPERKRWGGVHPRKRGNSQNGV